MVNIIPTRITVRKRKQIRTKLPHTLRNLNYVNIIKQEPIKSKLIPQSFMVNARSIVKPDTCPALYAELNSNNIDFCCIPETWLHQLYPAPKFVLPDFIL